MREKAVNVPRPAAPEKNWLGNRAGIWDGWKLVINQFMPVWEYKVITSGKGGFATPALLESFLNQLGKDEWEILHFQSLPDNPLAFTGLARRPTQRDWTLEDAAAAAARVEADKLRAEFEAKFKGTQSAAGSAEEKTDETAVQAEGPDGGLRRLRDTESDMDPDAPEEEGEADEWEKLSKEDELPTLFEAIEPLMRRNQRGAGMSVGVDHLAKKWGLEEEELLGALRECGFTIPDDEDAKPAYVEYDGDLYWVNVNRRGELWINTKEKPRPVFRVVAGTKIESPAEEPSSEAPKADAPQEAQAEDAPSAALPEGPEILEKIRPLMRRNRGGQGGSGSVGFLSRALKCRQADLEAAFTKLGLNAPAAPGENPPPVEISGLFWWLNRDQRGGIWINGGEAQKPESKGTEAQTSEASAPAPLADGAVVLAAVRLLLKKTRTGASAGRIPQLAETLGKTADELISALTAAGLKLPEKSREKPVFVEHAGEIFWLNKNAKEELWLNAKASKFSGGDSGDKPHRSRSRRRDAESEGESAAPIQPETAAPVETPAQPEAAAPVPPAPAPAEPPSAGAEGSAPVPPV